MFQTALILMWIAQIIHFSRHWVVLSVDLHRESRDRLLKNHLSWSAASATVRYGDTRPGSAMGRLA